jgi:hypothetical protein
MTLADFQDMIAKESLQDLWWLALDDNVQDDQFTVEAVAKMRQEHPQSSYSLLNVAHTEDQDSQWFDFDGVSAKASTDTTQTEGSVAVEIKALREQVNALQGFIQQIHGHFIAKENLEMKEVELKERERFLEESEEALLMKIQQQEEQLAELEQLKENVEQSSSDELKAM